MTNDIGGGGNIFTMTVMGLMGCYLGFLHLPILFLFMGDHEHWGDLRNGQGPGGIMYSFLVRSASGVEN